MVDQQYHGRSQELGPPTRLFPTLRKAQMHGLAPRLGAECDGQLTDQTLALAVQDTGQTTMGGMAGSCQLCQGIERGDPSRFDSADRRRRGEVDRSLGIP